MQVADDIAAMNDTLIFLVLGALALIFKWLTSHASGDAEKPEPPSPNEQAPPRPPAQSEEERIRRFLEALGAPPGTRPPPPVRPRRVVTPVAPPAQRPKAKRSWVQPLPPLVTTPKDLGPPPPTTTSFEPAAVEVAPSMTGCAATANHLAIRAGTDAPRDCALSCHAAPAVKHIAPQPCQRSPGGYSARSAWSAARLASPRRSP